MNTADQQKINENRGLSNFVHELNVFRRQIALYPPAHPKTLAGAGKILAELAKLGKYGDCISLGVTPDSLIFKDKFLDLDNPSCRDLATFFSKLDIAVVSFYQNLSTEELIEFWRLLSSRISGRQSTALELALKEHQIIHIRLQVTDYSAFTSAAPGSAPSAAKADIWKEFVQTLMPGNDSAIADVADNHADQLAQMLNNAVTDGIDCTAMTGKLVSRLLEQCRGSVNGIGGQLYEFSKKLKPSIRQRFHEDTLRTLEQQPHAAGEIISGLPADFISEALLSHSGKEKQLSNRLTDLLSTFAANTPEKGRQRIIQPERTSVAQQQSHIELLLLEDQHNEYLPDNYQQTLQKILTGQIRGSLPENLAQKYRNSLAEQMVEHQCCEIIFDLLETDTNTETEGVLQSNLADLSRFFLDTGDFQALQKTLSRWLSFTNSGRSKTNILTEKLFSSQLQPSFIADVLNSVPIWHNEKLAEISDYLTEVGEPYVEPLVERLGGETDKNLRKIWMTLLLELGSSAHPAILAALDDGRWYLVRNLLVIMEQQKGKIPPKTLLKLCDHPHPEVRCEALRFLFRVNPSAANRLLTAELENADPQTLKVMIPLAVLSSNDRIFNQLNRLLETEPLTAENLEIKLVVLASLSTAPHPDCLLSVMRLVARKEFFLNRLRKRIKSAATDTLRAYPRKQVIALLRHMEDKQRTTIQDTLSSQPLSASRQSQ